MKIKTEICSICRGEDCSGKEYDAVYYKDIDGQLSDCNFEGYTFDKSRVKKLKKRVCESQTEIIINQDIFNEAGKLFEAKYGESRDVFICDYNTLKTILKKHKFKKVPRERIHFIECGVFAKAYPTNGDEINLEVSLSHFKKPYKIIYNNFEKD